VWKDNDIKPQIFDSLREIDLYSFQGLLKSDAEQMYKKDYPIWKNQPAQFEVDGHFPVRELWHRASLTWNRVLKEDATNTLVVAHNAINQALICNSVGLDSTYFRRLVQSNGGLTALDFFPSVDNRVPKVVIDRMNQSPGIPSWARKNKGGTKFILIRHAATDSTAAGSILGTLDENLSKQGKKQVKYICDFLKALEIDKVICSPSKRTVQTCHSLAKMQTHAQVEITLKESIKNIYLGDWQGKSAMSVRGQPPPRDAESLEDLWTRTGDAWQDIIQQAAMEEAKCVVVVGHAAVHAALICHALELTPRETSIFRLSPASMSVIDFPKGVLNGPGNIACTNFMSHLEEFADPTTIEEEGDDSETCGWDGCF